jgi:hypothetical protein
LGKSHESFPFKSQTRVNFSSYNKNGANLHITSATYNKKDKIGCVSGQEEFEIYNQMNKDHAK